MYRLIGIIGCLCLLFSCQVPALSPNLKPCNTSAECNGLACIQGLCAFANTETTEDGLPLEGTAETSVEPAPSETIAETSVEPAPSETIAETPVEPAPSETIAETPVESAPSETIAETPVESVPVEPQPEKLDAAELQPEPSPESPPEPPCRDGEQRDCYTGPSGTEGIGECKKGKQNCMKGLWGSCESETTPVNERCNGKDDDCDGKTDETYTDLGKACSVGLGICKRDGKFVCKRDESGTECDQQPGPKATEDCNGKDDDCDGNIDEGLTTRECKSSQGCKGVETCSLGAWGVCVSGTPQKEVCNGLDDNCDGFVDNLSIESCGEIWSNPGGVRTCIQGTVACASGQPKCLVPPTPTYTRMDCSTDKDCQTLCMQTQITNRCVGNVGAKYCEF